MSEYIEREALLNDLRQTYEELKRIYEGLTHHVDRQICEAQLATFMECGLRIKEAPAANVVVLPCKPGDTIYRIVRWGKRNVDIRERIVSSVEYNAAGEWVIHSTGDDVLGKNCFLSREEAERALGGADNAVD